MCRRDVYATHATHAGRGAVRRGRAGGHHLLRATGKRRATVCTPCRVRTPPSSHTQVGCSACDDGSLTTSTSRADRRCDCHSPRGVLNLHHVNAPSFCGEDEVMQGIEQRVHTCVSTQRDTVVAMLPARVFQLLICSQYPAQAYKSAAKLAKIRAARTDWCVTCQHPPPPVSGSPSLPVSSVRCLRARC